jgi:hypothetical protein
MSHITEFTEEELKSEIKRRHRKIPLWVRQPLWWKLLDWVSDYIGAWFLIILSPIWFPFWLAHEIHKENAKIREEKAKEKGFK